MIVGGGSGVRMGNTLPKQFMELEGMPMIMRSARAFADTYPDIRLIVVLPAGQLALWEELIHRYRFTHPVELVVGGYTRFHSVKNGVGLVRRHEVVAVHDAARPVISRELIRRCFRLAEEKGSAVPVMEPVDSIREIIPDGHIPVNRENYRLVQTPQVFRGDFLIEAYDTEYQPFYTDDAVVVEEAGFAIYLTTGERTNIKVTYPEDFRLAAWMIKQAGKGKKP
ncbi:MAG TPA: 2-C-methyl-D-erythritol 4-phosphate cytidylyltransferase [Bacteroidetes bacterium]|nr:2-C-methyl-D-erythritol 4-phosphate cytidylyltransferase [Bacteroidota bacterium]